MNKYMQIAYDEVIRNIDKKEGGPFGAVIVRDNTVISVAHNEVLKRKDPTAHAEVMAIRYACEKLGTHDLSGCEIYATAKPCPMCKGAIQWSGIKKVFYSGGYDDTLLLNFDDQKFDDEFMAIEKDWRQINNEEFKRIVKAFEKYKKEIHY